MEKIKVAVIAAGSRSVHVVGNLLRDSGNMVEVAAVFDPDRSEMERACGIWEQKNARLCASAEEAIRTPGVAWVMIFSPNVNHIEHVEAAFRAGKDVFCEKPLATTLEDCEKMYRLYRDSGRRFATGFVLRYAPIYRKVKELLDSGRFGRILAVDANENIPPFHGAYIMCNWRRFSRFAGPHILEKCCHDLDLLNWFIGSLPSKAAAFGSREFFVPENENLRKEYPREVFSRWRDAHAVDSPFTSEKDLIDTQTGIFQYRNGVKVMFQATMSNAIPERRMYFSCTRGTLIVELYSSTLRYSLLGEEGERVLRFDGDGHGGGDDHIMKELFEIMRDGGQPKCGGNEGLESAVATLAYDRSMRENRIVDLEEVWKRLDR